MFFEGRGLKLKNDKSALVIAADEEARPDRNVQCDASKWAGRVGGRVWNVSSHSGGTARSRAGAFLEEGEEVAGVGGEVGGNYRREAE